MPEILQATGFDELARINYGFFTRSWGTCGLSDKFEFAQQLQNRAAVAGALGVLPENLLSCRQVHSPDVVTVTKIWDINARPEADAMVTNVPGLALGILTADCVPLLFVDPVSHVVGGAHAGWRGALGGVIENTLAAMERLGSVRAQIRVAIGPCIGPASYEVGAEFPAPFVAQDANNRHFFRPATRAGHFMFDLPGYVIGRLLQAGIVSIDPPSGDTFADEERFFSYRRNCLQGSKKVESLISVIVLNQR